MAPLVATYLKKLLSCPHEVTCTLYSLKRAEKELRLSRESNPEPPVCKPNIRISSTHPTGLFAFRPKPQSDFLY
jgi:hypothetical protein